MIADIALIMITTIACGLALIAAYLLYALLEYICRRVCRYITYALVAWRRVR